MLTIQLGEQKLPKFLYEKEGNKREFTTDHNTFFDFLQRSCVKKEKAKTYQLPVMETPVLPQGTVKYMALPDGDVVVFMEKKSFSTTVNYHGTKYKGVPFPNLLFVFRIKELDSGDFMITSKKLFAFKAKVLRDTTELFQFPYSHVHWGGSMCFFDVDRLQDLAQMGTYIYNWYRSEFTDHYYRKEETNLFNLPLRDVFVTTAGKPFDFEKLAALKTTVSDIALTYAAPYFPEEVQAERKAKEKATAQSEAPQPL